MLYAHALIHAEDGPRYDRGDEVPEDAFSPEDLEALKDGGAVSEDPYDPEQDRVGPPATVEIEGVRYVQVDDGAKADEDAR
jgi:hypothetical protein